MGNKYYLIRLDDACTTMDISKWSIIERILDEYQIRPMVGIIPANRDSKMFCNVEDANFWTKVKAWQDKGWTIALHGYDHVYITKEGGIHPLNFKSEFAGVDLSIQKEKLTRGYKILIDNGINPEWFFAPSHTFDLNTIQALKETTPITKISDTFSFMPFRQHGMIFFPQQMGNFRNIKLPGVWTFCFHPNTMKDKDFILFKDFIRKNYKKFKSFDDEKIVINDQKRIIDVLGSKLFFLLRSLKKIVK